MCQPHIYHRGLIDDHEVGVKLALLLPTGILSAKAEDAVQRGCVADAGGFRHTTTCFTGGRTENDLLFGVEDTICLDHRLEHCGLACAGTACDDGQIVPHHHLHCFGLTFGKRDADSCPDALHDRRKIDGHGRLSCHLDRFARGFHLLRVDVGQIDVAAVGDDDIREDHVRQLTLHIRSPDPL